MASSEPKSEPAPEFPAQPFDPTRELPPVVEPAVEPDRPPEEAPASDPRPPPGEWRPHDRA